MLQLEDVLLQHPAVLDAAVVPKPDPAAGEVPVGFIVLKPNTKASGNYLHYTCGIRHLNANLSAAEIDKWVADKLAHYKRLRGGVKFVDSIPKSASGKILRRVLKDQVSGTQTDSTVGVSIPSLLTISLSATSKILDEMKASSQQTPLRAKL